MIFSYLNPHHCSRLNILSINGTFSTSVTFGVRAFSLGKCKCSYPKQHNHNIEAYQTDIYQLKTQTNLRKVFDDVNRNDPCTCDISFRECNHPYIVRDEHCSRKFLILPSYFANWFLLQLLGNFINLPSREGI